MQRRKFVLSGIAATALGAFTSNPSKAGESKKRAYPKLRFGACADLHQDIYFDAPRRLTAFVDDMTRKKADFIIQLGDFCQPEPQNKVIMDIWNTFSGSRFHVIGNHDHENKHSKEDVVKFWGASGKYYSVDVNGYHLVVLDGNDVNPAPARNCALRYERFVSQEQLNWLVDDLASTTLPTIIFSHQSLDLESTGLENAAEVRAVLDRSNEKAGFRKVIMALSGHHHLDYHNVINGIHYVQVNSMSYHWMGDKYAESPFDEELNKQYPLLKRMGHYKDPLWAFFEISPDGILKISGKQSSFVGKSPQELGMPEYYHTYPVVPHISDRTIRLHQA